LLWYFDISAFYYVGSKLTYLLVRPGGGNM